LVFNSISRFNQDLSDLKRKPQNGYSSVCEDIKGFFEGEDFSGIFSHPTCIRHLNKSRVIKIRIPNSGASVGSSGGFRLIFIANPNNGTITFCHIYPKKGKLSKDNITDKELADILSELASEIQTLVSVEFMSEDKATIDKS
jgi:hypothetical protein